MRSENPPNHALHLTRPSRCGCRPRLPRAGSLSLGRWGNVAVVKARKSMKATIQAAIVLLASGFASAASPHSPAHAYTVQGTVELKAIRWSTNGYYYYDFETNHFDLQVKDCRWLVKLGSQRPEVFDYRIVSSDGASMYQLLSYETRQKLNVLAGKHALNAGGGCVTSGNIPHFNLAPEAGAVWIAYASWCHFAELSGKGGGVVLIH